MLFIVTQRIAWVSRTVDGIMLWLYIDCTGNASINGA